MLDYKVGSSLKNIVGPFPLISGFDPLSPAASVSVILSEAKDLIINHFYFADFKISFTFAKE